jgi:glycosyltransferase involved in cell wall biosynthesis
MKKERANNRYHIAHILPFPNVGGTEHATLRIARVLDRTSFESTIVCPEGTKAADLVSGSGFPYLFYRPSEPSYRRPVEFVRASIRLAQEFRRRGVDLVHCADILGGFYAGFAARLAGVPVLCHVRNRYEKISRRDRSFLHLVDRFVFVSQHTWENFGFCVKPHRGSVAYDGIDANVVYDQNIRVSVGKEFAIPETTKIIGMVARVAPQKDYETLIRAAKRVVRHRLDVRFLIVGDYTQGEVSKSHYERVKHMLDSVQMSEYFIFTDYRDDVSRLISAMDVFVLCTHHEGLPLVLLEAMAQSKPVVATAVDGIPEIVIDNKTGLLHDHQNDSQLASAILELLNDENHASALGASGRNLVVSSFSEEHFAQRIEQIYKTLLR